MKADIHSHVLCAVDDGARTPAQTGRILQDLSARGVTHLALTPHFYPFRMPLSRFLEQREASFRTLQSLPQAKGMHFSLGAEVYFTETLFNYDTLTPLCYENTNYMLTELETGDHFSSSVERRLVHLIEDYRIVPVLAHIDRYPFLSKDPALLFHLKEMGCLFQINLDSLACVFRRRNMVKLYHKGLVHFLGEDVHHAPMPLAKREKIFAFLAKKGCDLVQSADALAQSMIFST